ncbi:hemolysin III family protein [Streptomyces sp. NPDC059943]|uniref:hemolysin III family protein n=1 Tax=Streptomyces sp. NPDC059943 TaxID=3347010 RepID=UPI0036611E9C
MRSHRTACGAGASPMVAGAPVRYLPDFLHTGGAAVLTLIVAGGLLCRGAVVYALQRPDPSPRWFGFHEVFHALTVAAFNAHYIAIILAIY